MVATATPAARRRSARTTIRVGSATSRCFSRVPATRSWSRATALPPRGPCSRGNPRCDVILSDDGLQHYRLRRGVEIAVVDATRAFGNGWLLPAGPLREPAARLAEVDAVVALTDTAAGGAVPGVPGAFRMTLAGDRFVRVDDPLTTAPASTFAREGVHALAGIGHPERFFAQLAAMGIAATPHPFPDHHRFVPGDLDIADAQAILMTEKDAVKCEAFADERCWYLPVRAHIDEALISLVEGKLRGSQAA